MDDVDRQTLLMLGEALANRGLAIDEALSPNELAARRRIVDRLRVV